MASSNPSGIGRIIDFRYPSNRFAVAAMFGAGLIAGVAALLGGEDLLDAALHGVAAGGATFLAWTVGREVDPDRPWTAGVAAIGAGLLVIGGRPSLGQTAVLMLAARILTRSTGLELTWIDRGVVIVGSGYVASTAGGFPIVLVVAVMLGLDGHLVGGRRGPGWGTMAAVAAAAVLGGWLGDAIAFDRQHLDGGDVAAALTAGVGLLGLVRRPTVTVQSDFRGIPLRVDRVWAARVGVALAGGLAVMWAGGDAVAGLGPVWAALAAAALPTLWQRTS
jgi:hypothetical protein